MATLDNIYGELVCSFNEAKDILLNECPRVVVSKHENTTFRAFSKWDEDNFIDTAYTVSYCGELSKRYNIFRQGDTYLTVFKDKTTGETVGYLLWTLSTTWYNESLTFVEEVSTGNIKDNFRGMARLACEYLMDKAQYLKDNYPELNVEGIVAGCSQPDVLEQVRNTYEKKYGFKTLYQFYKEI